MNWCKRLMAFLGAFLLSSAPSFSQGNLYPNGKSPYPIIFVHGLDGSDETFKETMLYLNGAPGTDDHVGNWGATNVFDVVLTADNDDETSVLEQEVRWIDFTFSGDNINVGRRNFADNPDDFNDNWANSSIFAVNFAEERIRGANGILNDLFDHSNEAAILKQGYALSKVIQEVRGFTGSDKVILVGHSMGGLAIREYLQRRDAQGNHRWWIEPSVEDGHKVARVVTIGTPHYGWDRLHLLVNLAKSSAPDDRTQSVFPPNLSSEAVRDMSIEVEKGLFSGENYNGPYLFGGLEENAGQNKITGINFFNQDIDCDGDGIDAITGINFADINPANLKRDNPQMPLPSNIQYTWIVATGPDDDDDDVVSASRQYLDEPGDSIAVIVGGPMQHMNEGSAYQAIIRGMDEPDAPDFAYFIMLNGIYGGFFTRPIGNINAPTDTDCFKLVSPHAGTLQVEFEALFGNVTFVLKDANLVQIGNPQNSEGNIEFNLPQGGVYYLYLTKDVSTIVSNHLYYDFRVRQIAAPLAEFSAFPTSGVVPLTVQFTDLSTSSNPITSRLWNFGDGVTSTATSPTHTYTSVGNYTVSLTVSDGVYSDIETKTGYITVNPSEPLPVIEASGTITTNTVWVAGYVYKIVGSVTVANGVTLTIEPGVVVKFSDGQRLDIGGALVADGTPTQKIVFTSLKDDNYGGDTNNDGSASTPAAGNWDGMIFRDPSDDAVCKLDNCVIRYGGAFFTGSLRANVKCEGASPTISNNELSYSATHGIFLDGSSPQISGNVIANNSGGFGIYAFNGSSPIIDNNTLVANIAGIHSETSTPTITNNTFTNAQGGFAISLSNMPAGLNPMTGNTGSGNYFNGIALYGGLGTTSTLRAGNVNLPYVFSGLTINAGATLTIEPGVVVKFSNENRLTIDGALVADGTPTQKIVFTSLKDDNYGGDTNNDGSASTPAAGNWDGMIFRDPSDDAVCKLDNCVIRYGGAFFTGSLRANVKCEGTSPTISNNELSYSATHGIFLDGSSPQISGNVIANNLNTGVFAVNGSSPIVNGNSIFGNSGFGLINVSTSNNINAHQNWWGHPSGPLDNSDDRVTGGWFNPNGLGNPVSNYVDYDLWLTAPPTQITYVVPPGNPPPINLAGTQVSLDFETGPGGIVSIQELPSFPPQNPATPSLRESASNETRAKSAAIESEKTSAVAVNQDTLILARRYWEISSDMPAGAFTYVLRIGYNLNDFPAGLTEENVNILYFNPDSAKYLVLPTVRDPQNDSVYTTKMLSHFGRFALGVKKSLRVTVTFDFPMTSGAWYLISLPVTATTGTVNALFPNAVAAFGWDYTNQSYIPVTTLVPGQAYWLLLLESATASVSGQPLEIYTQSYTTPGWSLIGSTQQPSALVDDPDGSVLAMFGWDAITQSYIPIDPQQVEPKGGYWILVYEVPSTVTIGSSNGSGRVAKTNRDLTAFYAKYGALPPPPPSMPADKKPELIPESYGLSQNYPNPFNPETVIEYQLPQAGRVRLKVYDVLGRQVRTLVDQEMPAGFHQVKWDGKDDFGRYAESGIYLYKLHAGEFMQTRKTLLLR